MGKKTKKEESRPEGFAGWLPTSKSITIPDTTRKRSYLRSLQSDRITVLVGTTEDAFQVPQDLLIQYSRPLGTMCSSGFSESHTRIIRLPEVETPVFEDFLIWIYAFEPRIDESKSIDALVDLAVFGDIYLIYHLKNQTSDAIRAGLAKDKWKPSPDMISKIYKSVPPGSILRELCSHGFAIRPRDSFGWGGSSASMRKYEGYSAWKTVFEESAEFGWDYFQILQKVSSEALDIGWGGACRFHDHSDIVDWKSGIHTACPFVCSWSNVALCREQTLGVQILGDDTPPEVKGIHGDEGVDG